MAFRSYNCTPTGSVLTSSDCAEIGSIPPVHKFSICVGGERESKTEKGVCCCAIPIWAQETGPPLHNQLLKYCLSILKALGLWASHHIISIKHLSLPSAIAMGKNSLARFSFPQEMRSHVTV